jgi:peptidoglycan/xylan/chitin deacetylase (PgdA/CDA1 family)
LQRGPARLGLVLVYHRTGPTAGDPDRELDPAFPLELLRGQLAHLRAGYRPVLAEEILEAAASRGPGDSFPVAVTLDDDLRSHLDSAAPLLRELGVPATVFLTGASAPPWWVDLQRAVDLGSLRPRTVPELEPALVDRAVRGEPRAIRRLARTVEALSPAARDALAARLRAVAGGSGPTGLSKAEVGELAREGIAIGFHTTGHYDLRTLDDEGLSLALHAGTSDLAEAAGQALTLVAYPHGKCDERVAAAARAAGFRLGFTGEAKAVRATDDPLRLGRLQPARGPVADFALQLVRALAEGAA